jgi:hypothetical protein
MGPAAAAGKLAAAIRAPFVGRETRLGALVSAVEAAGLGESVLALGVDARFRFFDAVAGGSPRRPGSSPS